MSKYKITEHYIPQSDMPMNPWWYGFYSEYRGDKKMFDKIGPLLLKRCYEVMLEESAKRGAIGFHSVDQITKKKDTLDELDIKYFIATVGIKWHEFYAKEEKIDET